MEHLFDTRPERPGFRLQRLEVFNWGTFDSTDGRIHRFEPQGRTSLLVGHNGTGKSTLVDAILTLLVDSRTRNYNVAAGAKKTERTPESYIKGAFDRTADESQASVVRYLRPNANHLTALSAVFRDEQLGKAFTLTQVLFLKNDGSDDKVYAIADDEHELKDDLAGLVKSDEVREHLKRRGYQTTKVYVDYQGWLAKRTGMRGKAVDMFNQTVHVKDIQSLNSFIRRHMLEAQDWRDKVERLLSNFNDLSIAHQELVRARRAEELLAPVETLGTKYSQQAEQLEKLEQQIDACASFFPVQLVEILEPEIANRQRQVSVLAESIQRLEGELQAKRESIRQLANEKDQAGGERLKQIPELIRTERVHLEHKARASAIYHERLKSCRIKGTVANAKLFEAARKHLRHAAEVSTERVTTLRGKYEEAIGTKAALADRLRDERDELELLEQRRTNLPPQFSAMRSRICASLNLDEGTLPFAAELIAIAADQRRWEASLEMVLRPFALSMLVPERHYPRVRAYVEANRITDARGDGGRLDYICVGRPADSGGDRIEPKSVLHKLQFKPRHDLIPWVRGEILKRFDFHCCESVDDFNHVARLAITDKRHVKFNAERHQKDDRNRTVDPRYFVLGWDNTDKKRLIAERIRELQSELEQIQASAAAAQSHITQQETIGRAAHDALTVTNFDAIDLNRHEQEIAALEAEKRELEDANDIIQLLSKRLTNAEEQAKELAGELYAKIEEKGKQESEIERVRQLLKRASADVKSSKQSGRFAVHEPFFAEITASLGEPPLSIEDIFVRPQRWKDETQKRIAGLKKPLEELANKLVIKMSAYLREFREESTDLDPTTNSLPSFVGRLEQLRQEDLPRYEKKFKDRLNDQVSTEIAVFNTELREECKHIKEKIAQLNEALAAVTYNPGTYMRLDPRPVHDREIDEFGRALRECLDESLEHTEEANEARFVRIEALVKRLSDKESTTWRNKVIDVRNWYDFAAQEIDRETQSLKSCYDGSSGQSGGEKAKLAFTILVAALAYQFDVDPHGHTPGRFHFVVVDEMFSKVDDQNARYALELFKQFGLQLLIVAPLDAKARVTEAFVDRYLQAVKDSTTSRSQLYSMTAQEYEEVVHLFSSNGSAKLKLKRSASAK
jgi:uncharacterized protein YPO0396